MHFSVLANCQYINCSFPRFLKSFLWLALSWLCRVGVSGCELGFTVIDVSSGSLGRIHGEVRRE